MIDASAFSKIAVVIDRDDQDESSIVDSFCTSLCPIITSAANDAWVTNQYQNSYQQESYVDFLLIVIPADQEGALETLLLEAISERDYDRLIVERSIEYVDNIQPIAAEYINKKRLKLKSYIGVTWAIQSPEKIFSFIDEQIRSVKWENSQVLARCFEKLMEI